jgi:hypothetical protein
VPLLRPRRAGPGRVCPKCGAEAIDRKGLGTERSRGGARRAVPERRVARLDRDVASGGKAEAVLARVARREVDLLVGTQMVTKGHDFPGVTLVGVLCADLALGLPDFRASERTFQLLTQVAGRAGRGAATGPRADPDLPTRGGRDRVRRRPRLRDLLRPRERPPRRARLPADRSGVRGAHRRHASPAVVAAAADPGRRAWRSPRPASVGDVGRWSAARPRRPWPACADGSRWQVWLRSARSRGAAPGDPQRCSTVEATGATVAVDVDPLSTL